MPPTRAKSKGYERARQLRKESTPAEKKLWAYLRGNKLNRVNFRRHNVLPSRTVVLAARTVAFVQGHAIGN